MHGSHQNPLMREVILLWLFPTEYRYFTHRKNTDGTVDSVCRQCLTTVAIERLEAMLIQREREHVCDLALQALPQYRFYRVN